MQAHYVYLWPCVRFAVSTQVVHVLLHAQPSSQLIARENVKPWKVFYMRGISPKLQATISCPGKLSQLQAYLTSCFVCCLILLPFHLQLLSPCH